jgi:Zn-dependent protease with chaperone function
MITIPTKHLITTLDPMKILLFTIALIIPSTIFSQDLIYRSGKPPIICELDTTTIGKELLKYKRFDMEGSFEVKSETILFIKNFEGRVLYPKVCIGNRISKLYHWPKANHLPPIEDQVSFASFKDAESQGYRYCPACMDFSTVIPDQLFEQQLGQGLREHFHNSEEIIYEHPRLQFLQDIMAEVLHSWPEPLKGYEYRILIYKSSEPNAMAIPGGNLYVSTGLLNMLEDRNEFKAILAHEIAHVERRHCLREYYLRQKSEAYVLLGAVFAGAVTTLAGGDSKTAEGVMRLAAGIGNFTAELVSRGYSRELEEEADIYSQVCLQESKSDKKYLGIALDKLVSYQIIRSTTSIGSGTFDNHPDLQARVNQVKNSIIYQPEKKIGFNGKAKFEDNGLRDFLNVSVSYIYKAQSSTDPTQDIIYLIGEFINLEKNASLKLDDFELKLPGIDDKIVCEGINKLIVYRGQRSEFGAYVKISKEKSTQVFDVLKHIVSADLNLDVASMQINKKGSEQAWGYRSLPTKFSLVSRQN